MRPLYRWLTVVVLCSTSATLEAQDQDVAEFCLPAECNNLDPECCVPDSLEMRAIPECNPAADPCDQPGTCTENFFEYKNFQAGTMVPLAVIGETMSDPVQGWSFAIKHDDAFLSLDELAVTVGSSDAQRLERGGICATATVPGGWISAFVISFRFPIALPVKERNTLAFACYELIADPGPAGTLVEFANRELNQPPVDINITVDGKAKRPLQLTNFRVKQSSPGGPGKCPDWAFYFGPRVTTDTLNVGDAAEFFIDMRNATQSPAFSLGATTATARGVTTYELSGELGTGDNRLIELIITDDKANTQTPETPNSATANNTPVAIVRGPAIAGFDGGDFLEFNLEPVVGGPGFFVGYLSDLNGDKNPIPVAGGDCQAVNEILIVKLTGAPPTSFQRGDADGNGEINISDAVLIIQIVVQNLNARYDCDDALDANDDGAMNIADAVPVLSWLFSRGDRLPAPFLACGTDNTADGLGCQEEDPICGGR